MDKFFMKIVFNNLIFLSIVSMVLLIGCSSSADLPTEVSGKWVSDQNNTIVDIRLDKNTKIMTIGGHTYQAEVNTIETDMLEVKVETETGDPEVWSLQQVWNDNGSNFKLRFRHNGTTEMLVAVNQS